jgi:hypothetical protein
LYQAIRTNFIVALVISVIIGGGTLLMMHPSTYLASRPGARPPVGLALFVAFQVGMWFYSYRNDEGCVEAACTGVILFAPVIASLLVGEVTDEPVRYGAVVVFGYLSLSHLAYAVANWMKSRKSWLDL